MAKNVKKYTLEGLVLTLGSITILMIFSWIITRPDEPTYQDIVNEEFAAKAFAAEAYSLGKASFIPIESPVDTQVSVEAPVELMTDLECVSIAGGKVTLWNNGGSYSKLSILAKSEAHDKGIDATIYRTRIGDIKIIQEGDYYQLSTPTLGAADAYRVNIAGVISECDTTGGKVCSQWPYTLYQPEDGYHTAFAAGKILVRTETGITEFQQTY